LNGFNGSIKEVFNHGFKFSESSKNIRFLSKREKPKILAKIIHNAKEITFIIERQKRGRTPYIKKQNF